MPTLSSHDGAIEPETEFELSPGEVKSRAAGGAVLLMGRGFLLQGLAFAGNLVLARLLVPEDFGIVAVGLTVMNIGQLLASAGLGAALIAREQPPTAAEYRAVTGLQLLVAGAIAGLTAVVAFAVGEAALVTALMVLGLPLRAFKTPAMLQFQRRLEFAAQIKIEIIETVVYLAVAIVLAAGGMGAWSLAIGMVARSLVGMVAAILLSPLGFVVPSIRFGPIRGLLSFGWRYQANGISQLVNDTALTVGIGAIAGLGPLGLWAFASRLLVIPRLLFEAMWRVGFPTFSRLIQGGEKLQIAPLLERTVAAFAVTVAATLCPLVAAGPALIPLLFGTDWTDVSLILPGAALALTIAGPIGLIGSSYFYAKGDATKSLVAANITGLIRLAVGLALLPSLGVASIGIGWAAGALCSMLYTVPRAKRESGAHLFARVLAPALSGAIAGGIGWLVSDALGVTWASAALAGLSAAVLWTLIMMVIAPQTLSEGRAMVRGILRSALQRARSRKQGRGSTHASVSPAKAPS